MSPAQWIDEWIVRPPQLGQPGFVIRDLIAETANDEGAHAQEMYGPTLARMDGHAISGSGDRFDEHEMAIVAIGEYVARRVREVLALSPTTNA